MWDRGPEPSQRNVPGQRALGRNRTCDPRFRKPHEHTDGMRLRYVSAGSGSGTALVDL